VLVAAATTILGAIGVYVVESGQNKAIGNFGDAIWWAIVTATTFDGDVSQVRSKGGSSPCC